MASPQKFENIDATDGPVPAAAGSSAAPGTRAWNPFSPEARLLASSLRNLPLTLLHGSDAAGRSALLQRGVLPLLGRRQDDRMAGRARAGAGAASAGGLARSALWLPRGSREGGEHVIFVDLADPLPPLPLQLASARRDRPGGRVLVVLQGVEHAEAADPDQRAAFWRILLKELQARPAALHLLIAAESSDLPALADLARSLPGFGDNAVRLPPAPSVDSPAVEPGSNGDAMAPVRAAIQAAAKTAPQTDAQWLATVHRAVERVAEHERQQTAAAAAAGHRGVPQRVWPPLASQAAGGEVDGTPIAASATQTGGSGIVAQPVPDAEAHAGAAPLLSEVHRSVAADPAPKAQPARVRRLARWLGGPAAASVLVVGWMLLRPDPDPEPASVARPSRTTESAPVALRAPSTAPPPTSPQPDPPLAIVSAAPREEPGQALLRALAPLPAVDLRVGRAALAGSLLRPGRARLALVRYDALQTLPADPRLRGLAVVAPLFIEPVTAWVPADSPLHHWHELRGRRLDTGAAGSGAELTAASAYRALFGQAPPATPAGGGDPASASASIGAGFGAALRVGDSPAPTGPGRGLRALTLAAHEPSTTALLRQYLPQALAGGEAGARTPAVMNFLIVDGGNAGDRERLAAAAWRALCRALPQLRADGHPSWAAVQPGAAFPAGRPYALAAQQAADDCTGTVAVAATSPAVTPRNR